MPQVKNNLYVLLFGNLSLLLYITIPNISVFLNALFAVQKLFLAQNRCCDINKIINATPHKFPRHYD